MSFRFNGRASPFLRFTLKGARMTSDKKSVIDTLRNAEASPKITGHDSMALERFAEDTRHMIVFDVLTWDCPVGDKGQRVRIFLTDEGYQQALRSQERGDMKIKKHACVSKGHLSFDKSERGEILQK